MPNLIIGPSTNPIAETQDTLAPSSVEADGQTVLYPMSTPSTTPAPSTTLPAGYLANGSMMDEDGILLSEYLDKYPQQLADLLKPMPASTFHSAIMKEAKKARKPKVPYAAKKNCALGMVIQAKKLVHRKKDPAPAVLVPMVQAASDTVHDADSFDALYRHLDAIYSNLLEG